MGMSTGGGKGAGQNEINVTPLIDVLLVLLIIFMLAVPVMMKQETLEIPRELKDDEVIDNQNLGMHTLKVRADLSIEYTDGISPSPRVISLGEVREVLKDKLEAMAAANAPKVVFVDFEKTLPWREVVTTMDTIRAMATDVNKNDVKVALKIKQDPQDQQPQQ